MGAKYMQSPKEVAQAVDVLFLMLGYPHDVKDMVFHPESGILNDLKTGSVLVDHTTSSPGLAVEIANACKERGV